MYKTEQLWFEDLCYTDLTKCYCLRKGCKHKRITNKQIIVVYTKLETVAHKNRANNKEFN